jgi:hypothetical protein
MPPNRTFDSIMPTVQVERKIREAFWAEAASRPAGTKPSDVMREAYEEYIKNHKLIEKHGLTVQR